MGVVWVYAPVLAMVVDLHLSNHVVAVRVPKVTGVDHDVAVPVEVHLRHSNIHHLAPRYQAAIRALCIRPYAYLGVPSSDARRATIPLGIAVATLASRADSHPETRLLT